MSGRAPFSLVRNGQRSGGAQRSAAPSDAPLRVVGLYLSLFGFYALDGGVERKAHLRRSAGPHALRRMHIRLRSMRPDSPSTPGPSSPCPRPVRTGGLHYESIMSPVEIPPSPHPLPGKRGTFHPAPRRGPRLKQALYKGNKPNRRDPRLHLQLVILQGSQFLRISTLKVGIQIDEASGCFSLPSVEHIYPAQYLNLVCQFRRHQADHASLKVKAAPKESDSILPLLHTSPGPRPLLGATSHILKFVAARIAEIAQGVQPGSAVCHHVL